MFFNNYVAIKMIKFWNKIKYKEKRFFYKLKAATVRLDFQNHEIVVFFVIIIKLIIYNTVFDILHF